MALSHKLILALSHNFKFLPLSHKFKLLSLSHEFKLLSLSHKCHVALSHKFKLVAPLVCAYKCHVALDVALFFSFVYMECSNFDLEWESLLALVFFCPKFAHKSRNFFLVSSFYHSKYLCDKGI